MKSKLIVLMLIVGGSAFAQSRFSFSIGSYAPGYYAPQSYYSQGAYGRFDRGEGDSGYWRESSGRQHERAERYGQRNHQQEERFMYGDSPALWGHQMQERRELRHEQSHERNGDFGAGYGPAHDSARDGFYRDRY